jgi:hypothetical protein
VSGNLQQDSTLYKIGKNALSKRRAGDKKSGPHLTPEPAFAKLEVAALFSAPLNQVLCRSGGIGRRAWFRSMYSQGCGGSSPFFGTKSIKSLSIKINPLKQFIVFCWSHPECTAG